MYFLNRIHRATITVLSAAAPRTELQVTLVGALAVATTAMPR